MPAPSPLTDWSDPWDNWPPASRVAGAGARPRAAGARASTRGAASSRRRPSGRVARVRHLRALRRDLLIDAAVAFTIMLALLIITAGLGVMLLLEIPIAAAVIGSFVLERRARRRRHRR